VSITKYPTYKATGLEWLEIIPSHWEVKRLKQFCDVFPSNVDKKTVEGETPVRLCNYTDVYYNDFVGKSLEFMAATATEEQIAKFSLKAGDTIITKDSETADDIAIAAYVPQDLPGVICGYHLSMVRPKEAVSGAFVKRLFDSTYAKSLMAVRANGLTRVGLSQYAIDNVELPLPPKEEQASIATFLDRETAKIDALIAEQQRLIELLQEKRQSVISHAVTKGLNTNAPMKDSGVEWLGEVPEHWDVVQIKWLSPVKRSASPRPIEDPKYFDDCGEYAWVRISDVTSSNGRLETTSQRLSELGSSLSVKLKPGSLFVSIAGSVEKTYITRIKACIHDGFVYFPGLRVSPEFLELIFVSGECFGGLGKLGTQLNLNTDTIGAIRIGVPRDNKKVDAIVEYCMQESERLGELEAAALGAVSLLSERRSALISAAVTGRIDVRGLVTEEEP